MGQAVLSNTTRRGILGGALTLGALTPFAKAAAKAGFSVTYNAFTPEQERFIEGIASVHPGGYLTATHAMRAGMDPKALSLINLSGRDEMMPALMFRDGARHRSFTPKGELL